MMAAIRVVAREARDMWSLVTGRPFAAEALGDDDELTRTMDWLVDQERKSRAAIRGSPLLDGGGNAIEGAFAARKRGAK